MISIDESKISFATVREQSSWICHYERDILTFIARRLPVTVVPDHLTVVGVAGSAVAGLGLTLSAYTMYGIFLAVAGLLINWLGDSLDGTLARVRKIERPRYGFFVDHVSDLASQFFIVLGLGLSPWMRYDIALLALTAYLAIFVYTLVKLHVSGVMRLTYFGIGPTEVRLSIAIGIVISSVFDLPHLGWEFAALSLMDMTVVFLLVVALVNFIGEFRRDARALARLEPSAFGRPIEVSMIEVRSRDDG